MEQRIRVMLKRLLVASILVVGALYLFGCSRPSAFRVMSFNVRYATDDGPNAWDHRRNLVVETIRDDAPDVLGLQEPLAPQVADLRASLPNYGFVGVGRDDGIEVGEFAPIFYRSDRFTLLEQGVFWLSAQPEEPGSVGWDAALPRIATWARLRFKEAPLYGVQVVNVHFDHRGREARRESARMVRDYVDSLDGRPVVVLGDFNCDPTSEPYRILTQDLAEHFGLRAAFADVADTAGTYHGFTGAPRGGRIDWILFSSHFESPETAVDCCSFGGRYPSDHFPVTATLRMRGSP